MRFFGFFLAPLLAPFRAFSTLKRLLRPPVGGGDGQDWLRPDDHQAVRAVAAKTSRLIWYCTAAGPLLAALALIYGLPYLLAYNLVMASAIGVVLALRYALIARQMETGDLERSRIRDAFRDQWWFPPR
ncbi:hypothetical protein CXB49_11710 [Chromobacterium sp. ATCC 53434]|uniref:hypothetical protein n=1 Tax=Chromobacterium TaxID=535 RepID=UPI000C78D3B0|nr:hypothetical protein [Chromobacterium sp. ATCC 53434]AUH51435.1 hypothetical protein CXB49_11710 [Chromobacterium sp. ATCC 53434]